MVLALVALTIAPRGGSGASTTPEYRAPQEPSGGVTVIGEGTTVTGDLTIIEGPGPGGGSGADRQDIVPAKGYSLSVEPGVVVAPPGSEFAVSLDLKGFNGFEGEVDVALAAVFYYSGGFSHYPPSLMLAEDVFSVEESSLEPGGTAKVNVFVSPETPPGSYLLVLQPVGEGVYGAAGLVRVFVPMVPGYVIVPEPPEGPVELFEEAVVRLNIIPVGGYDDTVELNVEPIGAVEVVSLEPSSGVPPFTAELRFKLVSYAVECGDDGECVKVERDPWEGLPEGATSNLNAALIVADTKGVAKVHILVGLEEPPRRPGFFEALLNLFLLPFYFVLSVSLSGTLVTGLSPTLVSFMPVPTAYLELAKVAVQPYQLLHQQGLQGGSQGAPVEGAWGPIEFGGHWLRISMVMDDGSYSSTLRVAAVSEARKASIMTLSSKMMGSTPIQVYAPGAGGEVELRVLREDGSTAKDVIRVLERGSDYVIAVLEPTWGAEWIRIEAVAGDAVLDRVVIESSVASGEEIKLLAVAEPGAEIVVAAELPEGIAVKEGPLRLEPMGGVYPDVGAALYKPRLHEAAGLPAVIYSEIYQIEYYYPGPGGYQRQGVDDRVIPGAGPLDAPLVFEGASVTAAQGHALITLKLRNDLEPGLYLIYITLPPNLYRVYLAIIIPPPPEAYDSLEPFIVKVYKEQG